MRFKAAAVVVLMYLVGPSYVSAQSFSEYFDAKLNKTKALLESDPVEAMRVFYDTQHRMIEIYKELIKTGEQYASKARRPDPDAAKKHCDLAKEYDQLATAVDEHIRTKSFLGTKLSPEAVNRLTSYREEMYYNMRSADRDCRK
ncbi:hypothetical protein [Niveispirillum fermenti]|uniref:hypothetical protein n=1 Tax=Niveispirillum fermenti TaxID=1233113 RepID=UPI003A8450BD